MLGCSSGEDESSFEERMPSQTKQSSLTAGLKRPVGTKKQTSFKEELASRLVNNKSHEDEEVFASDDEDSSAIEDDSEDDDDDDEDWEDDGSEGPDNGINDRPLFQRVDSKHNLVSRRSLLTSLMHEGDRSNAFASMAQSQPALRKSKTQGHMDPSVTFSEIDNDGLTLNGAHMKRSKPMFMTSNSQTAPIAFSPRTTRRHMLATEMTESLRKAVLYERQQKKATANAILKRRHTTQDLTNIRHYPTTESEDAAKDNHSWNDDYASGGLHDYHQSGW